MRKFSRIFLCFFLFSFFTLHAFAQTNDACLDRIVFLGDSTTAHMQNRAAVNKDRVWATKERYLNLDTRITSAKIEVNGEELTIAEATAKYRPDYLVITLGVDYGVYYYRDRPEAFRACYEKLLDAISAASPDTVVVLQSVFPVGVNCAVITNDMIDRANAVIRTLAADRGLYYLDANEILRGADGYLRSEYIYSEDGIHLTEAAYAAILQNICAHAQQFMR